MNRPATGPALALLFAARLSPSAHPRGFQPRRAHRRRSQRGRTAEAGPRWPGRL